MTTTLLYVVTVTTGGSVWLATKFQLGVVPPELSLVYRFGIASTLLFVWAKRRGVPLRFRPREHCVMALLGVLIFAVNFRLLYMSAGYLTTGLIAVIFSTSVLMNIVNGAVFLGQGIEQRTLLAAGCGLAGMLLVFGRELGMLERGGSAGYGVVLALGATFAFSLGNMVAARNRAAGLPVLSSSAYSMAYGALALALFFAISGGGVAFDPSGSYVVSLLYLAVFGSVVGYGTYFELIGRVGTARAAYATIVAPILALGLSMLFEGMILRAHMVAGLLMIGIGNVLIIGSPRNP